MACRELRRGEYSINFAFDFILPLYFTSDPKAESMFLKERPFIKRIEYIIDGHLSIRFLHLN